MLLSVWRYRCGQVGMCVGGCGVWVYKGEEDDHNKQIRITRYGSIHLNCQFQSPPPPLRTVQPLTDLPPEFSPVFLDLFTDTAVDVLVWSSTSRYPGEDGGEWLKLGRKEKAVDCRKCGG